MSWTGQDKDSGHDSSDGPSPDPSGPSGPSGPTGHTVTGVIWTAEYDE